MSAMSAGVTARQRRAITALAQGQTQREAAGVTARTVRRWLRLPAVVDALATLRRDAIREQRHGVRELLALSRPHSFTPALATLGWA